jgi:type IV secretion system protein VirB4
MRFLHEFQKKPVSLADHLPWAALIAPSILLNKDGSFSSVFRFRGPDLDSSTPAELLITRARFNTLLKRLGTGWCLHVEAHRHQALPYPDQRPTHLAALLVDQERRYQLEGFGSSFETDHYATFTWLPPADQENQIQTLFFGKSPHQAPSWHEAKIRFQQEILILFDLLTKAVPEAELLKDEALLTYLHATISPKPHPIAPLDTPVFLDCQLSDAPLRGGLNPMLGDHHLRCVSIRSLPARTLPGLLDALGTLPFEYRWVGRFIALDKTSADAEILRIRKRWFAKRKGMGALLREALTKEDMPLLDTDALAKTHECDDALEALGAEACAFGWLTLTVTLLDKDEAALESKARAVEAALNHQGFVARTEDLNAVEAWLGSLPGEPYADVRRPLISTLNLCDLLPISAIWAGPKSNNHLASSPLLIGEATGSTPFRLSLHVGDVGHSLILGPTGSGKSALLAFIALQWLRYKDARIIVFDQGRSARCVTHCVSGQWHSLSHNGPFALQPLAHIDQPEEMAWASDWLLSLASQSGLSPKSHHKEEVWRALNALAKAPAHQRTLSLFTALCQDRDLSSALEPFTLNGPHGPLLDSDQDHDNPCHFETYETSDLFQTPSALAPVLTALFHKLERQFKGEPTLLILDEAWLYLGETSFAAKIRQWLKTLRKKNVSVIFATQSLDDITKSSLASALIESCPTHIFLPNPRALEPATAQHYQGLGLNARQLSLLAHAPPKRSYYIRQPHGRRLFELALKGTALALCGASSPEDQNLIDTLIKTHNQIPSGEDFTRAFLKAKGFEGVDTLFETLTPQSLAS